MKIEEFINILRKLQTVGVDVSKMTQKDTTETLAKKSGISKEKLGEIGLEPTLKIGIQKYHIAQAYRGQGTSKPPTKEQVEELAKLGISLEKRERDIVQEFIDKSPCSSHTGSFSVDADVEFVSFSAQPFGEDPSKVAS